jgi:hypothetical protein
MIGLYIFTDEKQTAQWPKGKVQKEKTTIYKAYAYNTKDRVTRTPLKTGCELKCSGRVSISCSISDSTKTSKIILNLKRKPKKMGNTDPIDIYSNDWVVHFY